jgi:hypothetical protein
VSGSRSARPTKSSRYTKRRNKRQVTAKPKRKRKIDDIAQCHTFYSFQPHRNKKKKKKRWMEKSFFTIDIIFFVGISVVIFGV